MNALDQWSSVSFLDSWIDVDWLAAWASFEGADFDGQRHRDSSVPSGHSGSAHNGYDHGIAPLVHAQSVAATLPSQIKRRPLSSDDENNQVQSVSSKLEQSVSLSKKQKVVGSSLSISEKTMSACVVSASTHAHLFEPQFDNFVSKPQAWWTGRAESRAVQTSQCAAFYGGNAAMFGGFIQPVQTRPLLPRNGTVLEQTQPFDQPTCSYTRRQPRSVPVPSSLILNPDFRNAPPSPIGLLDFRYGAPLRLPHFAWADPKEVWNVMCWKERAYCRNPHLIKRHAGLTPKMRSILIDWMADVCESYKLHRETFHLAVDFVDRYLARQESLPKSQLQLVGVTALFIAAKLEEIYPPKLADFAFVTDSACSDHQILAQELIMLKTLNWALSPITSNSWLLVYLQLAQRLYGSSADRSDDSSSVGAIDSGLGDMSFATSASSSPLSASPQKEQGEFLLPQFPRDIFLQLSRLVDMCLIEHESLQFAYSTISAAAIYHLLSPDDVACVVSGYTWDELAPCVAWMTPYAIVVREAGPVECRPTTSNTSFADIPREDRHNIQLHNVDAKLWACVMDLKQRMAVEAASPTIMTSRPSEIFPTPPRTGERPTSAAPRTSFG